MNLKVDALVKGCNVYLSVVYRVYEFVQVRVNVWECLCIFTKFVTHTYILIFSLGIYFYITLQIPQLITYLLTRLF